MSLTANQNLPDRPKPSEPWTFKRLLSLANVSGTLTKIFVNQFDVLLAFLILVIGVLEISGRNTSRALWGLTILMLIIAVAEKHIPIPSDKKTKKGK